MREFILGLALGFFGGVSSFLALGCYLNAKNEEGRIGTAVPYAPDLEGGGVYHPFPDE